MTPLVKYDHYYLKREDLNVTGSIKDRAIEPQVAYMTSQGIKSAVISSTGNAAISAQHFCKKAGIELTIFVSPHIEPAKMKNIYHAIVSKKPISDAIKYAKSHQAYLLRQSTDETAINGYSKVATEILEQLPSVTSVITPIGSGATIVGISQQLPHRVRLIGVQSAANPTIAKFFGDNFVSEGETPVDSLTVKYLPLKNRILLAIRQHSGTCVAINNQEMTMLAGMSTEASLTLSSATQISKLVGPNPVYIITGTRR